MDRDDMLLEALTGLINANNEQMNKRFDKLESRFDKLENRFVKLENRFDKLENRFDKLEEEVRGTKLYIELVLEKKLNAFYDNTVRADEFHKLKEEVEEIKKKIS